MPSQPSKTHPFKSCYATNLYVTPAQFLAEAMCRRKALKEGTDLPQRFWQLPKWKREFALQVRLASGLLALYSYQAICRAMRTQAGQKIFSFAAKFIDPLIEEQERILARENAAPASAPPVTSGTTTHRPAFQKKTMKSKLKDM